MPAAPSPAPADHLAAYAAWLPRQPLSAHSRRAYRGQVAQYCAFLAAMPAAYGDPLREPHARDYAVRDYKTHLKTVRSAKPRTVNLAVNLGFNYGAELPDPERLLAGPGKLLRHVRIERVEDVERPALRRLLELASKHRMPGQPPS